MAKSSSSSSPSPTLPFSLILLFSITLALSSTIVRVEAGGGMVGGIEKIPHVKTNKEIQDLGRYCVSEYNSNMGKYTKKGNGTGGPVTFVEVVDGKQQVVSGMKYYLKISATTSSGEPKFFDAVVWVQLWKKVQPKQLLTFSPSPPTK